MSEEEEDDPEELARALAMSTGEIQVGGEEDEEAESLALALAMSKSQQGDATPATEQQEEKKTFSLSATLGPHSRGCRTGAIINNDLFATSGEQGDFFVWKKDNTTTKFVKSLPFGTDLQHGGLVFVLQTYGSLFASGGKDKTAQVFAEDGTVMKVLAGAHTNSIGSISTTKDGKLVTGAWDGTAMVWGTNNQVERKIADPQHQYAVEVTVLEDGRLASASAKNIILFNADGSGRTVIPQEMVRSLAPLKDGGFVSCSNDGKVKVWSKEGRIVREMMAGALTYTVAIREGTVPEIVCGGEDQKLRIFLLSTGELMQEILLPGAIRCVRVFPNGDLLVCASDRYAYIFTRSPLRVAGGTELERFQNYQAQTSSAAATASTATGGGAGVAQQIDLSKLPSKTELLATKGAKNGAIKLANEGGKAMAYSWSGSEWQLVGEAVGAPPPKSYDITVSVELGHRSFPLQFNRTDDARQVANAFCVQNQLPGNMVSQVQQYITQLQRQ